MQDNCEQLFNVAYTAFMPAPDDNPDCISFYRAWSGLRAAWGADFCDAFNSAVHSCACAASWAQDGQRYAAAVATLRDAVDKQRAPEEPRSSYFYQAMPVEPTERDARELFNAQWRVRFPGKRCNSKEANAKFTELRDKALGMVRERYAQTLAEHARREEQTEQENNRRRSEWMDKVQSMALFENAARSLGVMS